MAVSTFKTTQAMYAGKWVHYMTRQELIRAVLELGDAYNAAVKFHTTERAFRNEMQEIRAGRSVASTRSGLR